MARRTLWLGVAGVAVVGLGAVIGLAALIPGRVRATVEAQLAANDVSVGSLDLSLLSSFPLLEVRVTDLVVGDMLTLPEGQVGLDLPSCLWGDAIEVRTVRLVSPALSLETDAAEAEEASEPLAFRVQLDELDITDGSVVWSDPTADARAEVTDLDVHATGTIASDHTRLVTKTTIGGVTVAQGGVTWLRDTKWDAEVELDYDMVTGGVALANNRIGVNGLSVELSGTVLPQGDDIAMDLSLSTADTSFKSLLSLVPGAYSDAFEGVKADGTMALAGTVIGIYGDDLPGFDLALEVDKGQFQYAGLPVGVDGIDLDIAIRHPQGDTDLTEVDIRRFSMAVGGTPITGALKVRTPISDPTIDLTAKGRLDLGKLASAVPAVADADPPTGVLDLDVAVAGRSSDFQAQRTDKVKAQGTVKAKGLRYAPEDWPVVMIDWLDLALSAERAEIRGLDLSWKASKLSVKGAFDNVLPYAMAGETLTGQVTLSSPKGIDLKPFQGDTEAAEPAPGDEAVVVPVPENLDIAVDATFAHVYSAELDMEDVKGRMRVKDQTVTLESVKGKMLGGEVSMSGSYHAETDEHADVDMQIDAFKFDLPETMKEFTTLSQIAPVLAGAKGRFDSDIVMKARILRDGTPELSLLSSAGTLGTSAVELKADALTSIAGQLKSDNMKTLSPGGNVLYEIKEGFLTLKPFQAKLGTVPATVSGRAGVLDRSLDLAMDLKVPTSAVKGASVLSSIKGALPANVDVVVTLTGTYDKPKIGVKLEGDVVADVTEAVVEKVKEVANEAIDDLVAAARAQGDALVAAAEKEADRLRSEAKKAADKIRKDAEKAGDKLIADAKGNPVKTAVAKEAAKAGEKEADKAADKVESEADKAGDKVVAEAKTQRDKLIDDAEKKMKAAVK